MNNLEIDKDLEKQRLYVEEHDKLQEEIIKLKDKLDEPLTQKLNRLQDELNFKNLEDIKSLEDQLIEWWKLQDKVE